jgi:hypothetical protein
MPDDQDFNADEKPGGDDALGPSEANPLDREIYFLRQRAAVLHPRGSSTHPTATPRPQPDAGGKAEDEKGSGSTFRQDLMREYREHLRRSHNSAEDQKRGENL